MFIERTQKDDDETNEVWGLSTATHTGDESLVRQEDKEAADLNWLLARHGMDVIPFHQAYGDAEVDYDLDLMDVKNNQQAAIVAHGRLTPELKAKYPTWQKLAYALFTGELTKLELTPKKEPEPTPIEPA